MGKELINVFSEACFIVLFPLGLAPHLLCCVTSRIMYLNFFQIHVSLHKNYAWQMKNLYLHTFKYNSKYGMIIYLVYEIHMH